jgi:hypothetical protein
VRAWLSTNSWQDGVGAVSDRTGSGTAVRVDPTSLSTARELLAWALSQVAHGPQQWLELETFLADLWSMTSEHTLTFYNVGYAWQPQFSAAQDKDQLPPGPQRERAFWMDSVGTWAANAILVTLFHLGLVERGNLPSNRDGRHCFRLTPLGHAVFGAPEIGMEEKSCTTRFLTVQANHEVVAYLEEAEPAMIWPLVQLTRPTSSAAGSVRTLTLTRLSVYAALESGMPGGQIMEFLARHSKTGLPTNVAQSLAEWTHKHEALVIRTGVTLQVSGDEPDEKKSGQGTGQKVGGHFLVLAPQSIPSRPQSYVWDHEGEPEPSWELSEDALVRVGEGTDAVALARLSQFADPASGGWQISAASVRRARERGIPVEQILSWISTHQRKETPPLVEMAIRNWASRAVIFTGPLVMMQVPEPQAYEAIRSSERFRPLVIDCLPPDWFIILPEKHRQAVQLLEGLGFTIAATFFPSAEGIGRAGNSPAEADGGSPRQRRGRTTRTREL